jgi:hypothetical protein
MSNSINLRRRRNRNKKKKNKGSQKNLIPRDSPRFPNDIKQSPLHSRTMRYFCSTACANFGIRPVDLLNQILQTVNGSTTSYRIIGGFRLRRLSFYYIPPNNVFDNTSSQLTFRWAGTSNGPEDPITDTGSSYEPSCIKVVPPLESLVGFWYASDSTTLTNELFLITCSTTIIMDIDFEYYIEFGTSSTATLNSAAGANQLVTPIIAGVARGQRWTPVYLTSDNLA